MNITTPTKGYVNGNYPRLLFTIDDDTHLLSAGVKAQYRIQFGSIAERNAYRTKCENDFIVFPKFIITSGSVSDLDYPHAVIITAKNKGAEYNITPPSSDDDHIVVQTAVGVDAIYEAEYQLYAGLYLGSELITQKKFLPQKLTETIAQWSLNFGELLKGYVRSVLPTDNTPFAVVPEWNENINFRFAIGRFNTVKNKYEISDLSAIQTVEIQNIDLPKDEDFVSHFADLTTVVPIWTRLPESKFRTYGTATDAWAFFYVTAGTTAVNLSTTLHRYDTTDQTYIVTLSAPSENTLYRYPIGTRNHAQLTALTAADWAMVEKVSVYAEFINANGVELPTVPIVYFVSSGAATLTVFWQNTLGTWETTDFFGEWQQNAPIDRETVRRYDTNAQGVSITKTETARVQKEKQFIFVKKYRLSNKREREYVEDFIAAEQYYALLPESTTPVRIVPQIREALTSDFGNSIELEFEFTLD